MKKVGICTLNSKYVHASLAPWCLLAGVNTYCTSEVTASVWEGTVNQNIDDIIANIQKQNFDIIGFSCYIWNMTFTQHLISRLKKDHPQRPIVVGGPEVSFCQEQVLTQYPDVDFVLSGEGELPFAQLIDHLCGDLDLSQVEGLSYRTAENTLIIGKPYFPKEQPPSPYCDAYFQNLQGKIAYMESSRGCPFSCAFCLSGQEKGVRYFDLERVKKEILQLAQSGTKTIKFVDRTFNSNIHHAEEILVFILQEYGKGIPTTVCCHLELAGDILKDSTLDLISQMPKGAIQLEIGMQSFCEKTLDAVGRSTNNQTLIENINKLVSFQNHHLHIDLIAGLPYENLEEFQRSFNIGYSLHADMLQLGFLKVLHGSEIGENPQRFPCEYSPTPPYQVISTPWLSPKDMELLEKVEDSVDRLYNSGRFSHTLAYLLEATKYTPFHLLQEISLRLSVEDSPSLDTYVDRFFALTQTFTGVDTATLRDTLVLDRIQTNSTANLPKSLMIVDPNLRRLKIALEQQSSTACPKGVKRFVGILYSQNQGVYVDYPPSKKRHQHFFEKYTCHFVPLSLLDTPLDGDSSEHEN